MSNKKFILEAERVAVITSEIIRINKEAAETIKELQIKTGLSASKIASQAILYAAENLEIKEG